MDAVAELDDVADRLLDEEILVADEDAADDLRHRSSDCRRCSMPVQPALGANGIRLGERAASTAYSASSESVGAGKDSGAARSPRQREPPS